jgi:hypothetical protein
VKSFHTSAAAYKLNEELGTVRVQVVLFTLVKTLLSITCGVGLRLVMEVSPLQLLNAELPMLVKPAGKLRPVKALQL